MHVNVRDILCSLRCLDVESNPDDRVSMQFTGQNQACFFGVWLTVASGARAISVTLESSGVI